MARNLHSPTKLTEFSRDFEEEPETLFTKFVNKITNVYSTSHNAGGNESQFYIPASSSQGNLNANISRASSNTSINSSAQPVQQITVENKSNSGSSISTNEDTSESMEKSTDDVPPEPSEGRTMANVLKRISKIVASRNNNLRSYKDTELHRLWMPDSKAKECYDCCVKFSTFRRKHHCRLCGQIFCSKCCNQLVPGKIIMCSGLLKVCTYCSKIVLSYLKSPDITQDLKSDLQALQDDLSNKLSVQGQNTLEVDSSVITRKISVGYQEERLVSSQGANLSNKDRVIILQQSNSLKALHEEMANELSAQNCGIDLIAFLITNQKSSNKIQAVAILNAMLEAGFLVPLVPDSDQIEFDENLHYKLLRKSDIMTSSGNFQLDMDVETSAVLLSRTPQDENSSVLCEDIHPPKSMDGSLSFQSVKDVGEENTMRSTTKTTTQLLKAYCEHEELLLSQLLRNNNLDQSWAKVLIPICARISNQFRPEYSSTDMMDIRNHVNFKKIPGGQRNDSFIVNGCVFTKNVAHKEMATRIQRPRILLLQCPIVYERNEGRFVSIENILLQEKEYLRNVTARILSLKPNVVLVQKNVAGIAQDMLREKDITLVLDVKSSVLERLARCLQCDIVTSIKSNIEKPKLGVCDEFYIESFEDENGGSKTLMFFKTLSNPRGCSCLLRGTNNQELARVKKVASFLVFSRYNWRLEMAFLLDEFARPPSPKRIIFDSKEHTPSEHDENDSTEEKDSPRRRRHEAEGSETETDEKTNHSEKTHQSESNVHKRLTERKSEDKLNIEDVSDFTDPLRAPDLSPTKFDPESSVEFAVQTPYDNRFRSALSSTVLSVSPFVSFPLPFLETEQGRKCLLRSHFPNELYFSKQWSENIERHISQENNPMDEEKKVVVKPYHEFVTHKITTSMDNREFQTLLAEYRAFGGRIPKTNKMTKKVKRQASFQQPQKISDDNVYKDALDLVNHQRICVLFCSYYYSPKSPASFCAYPILLDMKFYGQHDIMLGQFLQRYCFKSSYICPLCNLPMMDHVRRYVHSMGCVQVSLIEDACKTDIDKIFLTSWCSICEEVAPSVAISHDTYCLSFAKYLELRFHGHAYKKRVEDASDRDTSSDGSIQLEGTGCNHSLHRDYVHYFSYKGICAKFKYTSVDVWEIGLPPLILHLKKPKPFDNSQVLEDIKNFAVKGYEVYSKIYDRIAEFATDEEVPLLVSLKALLNGDQLRFRQQVEIVQTLLTEKVVNSYDLSDAMLMAKRTLAESIEMWGPRLHEAGTHMKNLQRLESNPPIDAGTICTEDLKPELESPTDESKHFSEDTEDSVRSVSPPEPTAEQSPRVENSSPQVGTTKGKEFNSQKSNSDHASDKKSIKQIISQLLPTASPLNSLQSPLPSNEHLTLPLGAFPILVHDQDISSIVAYSLVSIDYKRAVENLNSSNSTVNDPNSSPNVKRKSQDGSLDTDDKDSVKNDEDKKVKSISHIELSFQDASTQFTCKIYFAREFDQMRSNVLKPPKIEKRGGSTAKESVASTNHSEFDETRISLARSLCRSVQWEARGGKSGSKFSKTLDDRFVLKEMSKGDVGIFENFAPTYFEYVSKCLQQNQPTLLAKILGVFKVSIKKKDSLVEKSLLVMENLFYDCDIQNKYDLKGSERNRMVNPTTQSGEIVLLDENLIQTSWSQPLYILSHSKTILREAIIRDSSFLEKNDVMDYSLLVGLNNKENVLVLGIIDYIRTYTFDKKIESIVKQTGLLGGQGKLPTVISPQRYRQRFGEAMERYFFSVPDRWEGLSKK